MFEKKKYVNPYHKLGLSANQLENLKYLKKCKAVKSSNSVFT